MKIMLVFITLILILEKIMEGKFHKPTFHNILIPFKGDEIKGNIKVRVDSEVGTSRRRNYLKKLVATRIN